MSKKRLLLATSALLVVSSLVAGCGKSATEPKSATTSAAPAKAPDPLTLNVYDDLFTDVEYQKVVEAPLKAKYPYITLNRTKRSSDGELADMQNLTAASQIPDIILSAIYFQTSWEAMGIPLDLEPLVKKYNTNLGMLDATSVDGAKTMSGIGKLTALPLYRNFPVTLYNKDLFDKFGVSYPKDGMTWDDALQLARKLTRTEGGVKYYGLFPGSPTIMTWQLSLNAVDPKTNKAIITSQPGFAKSFNMLKQIYSIPGMEDFKGDFFKDKNIAMSVNWLSGGVTSDNANVVNWDMVTIPSWPERPGIGSLPYFQAVLITKQSKHPDAAYQAITYLAMSTEVQTQLARIGRVPAVTDPKVLDQFGADLFKGKNLSVLQKTKMAPAIPRSPYETQWNVVGQYVASESIKKLRTGSEDVNTMLKEIEDSVNKSLAAQTAK